jgi:CDP-6-deoxy-D-xylo-4-hexulose-3-dehydrase
MQKTQTHRIQEFQKIHEILNAVREYIIGEEPRQFIPGETYITTSGASWNDADVAEAVSVLLGRWFGGKMTHEFERLLASFVKQRFAAMCNSGSSANLLAVSALTSKEFGERRLKPGDEVIVAAAGFPTTVNPIIQNGLIPVFVDIQLPQYNVLPHLVEEAISEKTKAVFLAHTLGNPYKARDMRDLCDRNELWHISDMCDALGAYNRGEPVAFWADISTCSFYPAHHISTMEGGAVITNNPRVNKVVRSFRDWGRDCWCDPGRDNTCGKRYDWQLGDLPAGYDHKYIYSEIGYNLKSSDIHAALGVNQIKRIGQIIEARQTNWEFYRNAFEEFSEYFILPEPAPYSKPSWFGFMLTLRDNVPFTRRELVTYLEEHKVGTRMLFAGNILRHPAYRDIPHRVSGVLVKSDKVMRDGFWIGVHPGITRTMQEYVVEVFRDFIKSVKLKTTIKGAKEKRK